MERDPRVGACSEVMEQEWPQQSLVSLVDCCIRIGAKQTKFWCVLQCTIVSRATTRCGCECE